MSIDSGLYIDEGRGLCNHPSTKSYRAYIAIVAMCAAICSYIHSFMFPLTSHVGSYLLVKLLRTFLFRLAFSCRVSFVA